MLVLSAMVLIVALVVLLQGNAEGNTGPITFYPPTSSNNETHVVYNGEKELLLRIEFPENCTEWSVEFNSTLFELLFSMHEDSNKSRGDVHLFGVDLDKQASLGEYSIDIYFNYTSALNVSKGEHLVYILEKRKAFDIQIVDLPTNERKRFSIDVQLYVDCLKVEVSLFSSADIGLDERDFVRSDLDVGRHSFETSTYREEVPRSDSYVGYEIELQIEDRILAYREGPVEVDWTAEPSDGDAERPPYYPVIIVLIVVAIVAVNLLYLRGRRAG